ncbi:hypothetical protein MSAN_00212300 [Mycena sanguinolenta]|uniref:Uncharacterized protein n=1 Tax=Mycena sanguinolenta TaxID=230812 RepID=A0A8H6ZIA1_9AGAR|nr:hypothetical protein MSAN_00212300 [Mycena sanguinolenta]
MSFQNNSAPITNSGSICDNVGDNSNNTNSNNTNCHNTNISNTNIHFNGPQFILNLDGKPLDMSLSALIANAFVGDRKQKWTLKEHGEGKFALKSEHNNKFLGVNASQQIATTFKDQFQWDILQLGGGLYKLMTPTGLALGMGSSAALRSPDDKSTQVYILDATDENRDAIKKGEIPTRQPVTPIQPPDSCPPTPGGNLNVTINDFSNSGSATVADAIIALQKFLASDTAKNIVIFIGESQIWDKVNFFQPEQGVHLPSGLKGGPEKSGTHGNDEHLTDSLASKQSARRVRPPSGPEGWPENSGDQGNDEDLTYHPALASKQSERRVRPPSGLKGSAENSSDQGNDRDLTYSPASKGWEFYKTKDIERDLQEFADWM